MNFLKQAATCVHTIGGTGAVQPNQSFRAIPSPSHGSHNSTAPHSSSLHSLLPSQTSSVTLRAFDAHRPNSSTTIQPASLLDSKPPLLAPMASTHSTVANAASSLPTVPPLHPPFADRQPKSAPLLHPFPLCPLFHHMACPCFNHSYLLIHCHCLPRQHLIARW